MTRRMLNQIIQLNRDYLFDDPMKEVPYAVWKKNIQQGGVGAQSGNLNLIYFKYKGSNYRCHRYDVNKDFFPENIINDNRESSLAFAPVLKYRRYFIVFKSHKQIEW